MTVATLSSRRCKVLLAGGFVIVGAVLLAWLRQADQTAQRLDAAAKASVYA